MNQASALRNIPSVDRLVTELAVDDLPRRLVTALVRRELAAIRSGGQSTSPELLIQSLRASLDDLRRARIQPVINGTGIIFHTNFGRSPLAPLAIERLAAAAQNYTNLEFDLTTSERGGRASYLEQNLALLCESESATVVNNCAAALLLILRQFTSVQRPRVIISRGELVQIGGGFRVPEILEASGATLAEVGTTNKTTLDDYRRAIDDRTALILKVHRSNFYMDGFVESPQTRQLVDLAHQASIPFVEDLGSGAFFDTTTLGRAREGEPASQPLSRRALSAAGEGEAPSEPLRSNSLPDQSGSDGASPAPRANGSGSATRSEPRTPHAQALEPTPPQVLAQGADLVCFSGDKLLGGPQAGIIAGTSAHITAMKSNPFFRALRCDKLVLSAIEATVELWLDKKHDQIPILKMMRTPLQELESRGLAILSQLPAIPLHVALGEGISQPGGGSLPRTQIPSITLDLLPHNGTRIEQLAASLRNSSPPMIGYISEGRLKLDLRTIFPSQDADVIRILSMLR